MKNVNANSNGKIANNYQSSKNVYLDANLYSERIAQTAASVAKGQIYETDKNKYLVTAVDSTSLELSEIKPMPAKTIVKTLVNPKTGEKITTSTVDNTPVLTGSTRTCSLESFAKLIHNKNYSLTKLAYIQKHYGMSNSLEINRLLVKQTVSL